VTALESRVTLCGVGFTVNQCPTFYHITDARVTCTKCQARVLTPTTPKGE
jgi:hypothetical protein